MKNKETEQKPNEATKQQNEKVRSLDDLERLLATKADQQRFTVRFPLEPEAKTLRIAIGPFGAAGIFDVDDIEGMENLTG